jgi:hypothetical protein
MYQLLQDTISGKAQCVYRLSDNALIPFDLGNVDYVAFKTNISSEPGHLLDVAGNVMSPEAVADFLTQIP